MQYDAHAEAQQRFFNATKIVAVAELLVDALQTHNFVQKGRCREADPLAKPFVHYTPLDIAATAGFAYGILNLKPGHFRSVLLGTFMVGEGLNVLRNRAIGCD